MTDTNAVPRHKWVFSRDGVPEEVERELWCWEAVYTDGTLLKQFDDDGFFHQFGEIDQTRLSYFRMATGHSPPITMMFLPGMKLIHFYRNARLNVGMENEVSLRLYCFGYQLGDHKVIMAIMPDYSVMLVDDMDRIKLC
jgi:hypothetical protein